MPDTGYEVGVVDSLAAVDRAQWDALFAETLEGYDYLTAVERAGLEGFRWRYVLASRDGALVAAVPAFLTDYRVETTLTGGGKRAIEAMRGVFPGFLQLGLACLGSPCATTVSLGIAPQVAEAERPALLQALLAAFEADARAAGCGLFASKDVVEADRPLWDAAARPRGYRPMASLPIASLDIDFPDMDAYFARLSYTARKDMRRKLRAVEGLRIEVREEVGDLAPRLMALYEQTRERADMSFEHLTAAYFTGVPRLMPGRAFWVLYFEGEDLLAANLLVQDEVTLLDKYFLMDAARGRALNLYFVSWFTNLRLCLERGLTHYRSGQAAYANKLRLGSRLTRTSIYFRHRNPLFNAVMQIFAPLFAADPTAEKSADPRRSATAGALP